MRLRLYDLRVSRFPRALGLCADNVPEIAAYANSIEETLLFDKAAGDSGWNGTFAEIRFNVSRTQPFITLPRNIARLEFTDVCDRPVPLNNPFVEYMIFGNGRMTTSACRNRCPGTVQAYARNNSVTFVDLTSPPQTLRLYLTDPLDVGKRVLLSGLDANDKPIYSLDNTVTVSGIFLALDSPFVSSPLTFSRITGVQKDVTRGQVELYQVDPTTGDEVLLLTMEPSETVASYRRYYFANLPTSCCPVPGAAEGTVQVRAIAKMEPVPVVSDTDYLLLTSREAFIEEAQSLRLSEADTDAAQRMAANHHAKAIRLLIGELSHFQGLDNPAVGFFPFGSASLDRVNLGMV